MKGRLFYQYNHTAEDAPTSKNSTVILQPRDVLHIPGLGFDGLVGYSPIAMAKNAIGLAIATEEYGSKFFANGAAPSGVLEHPGTIKDPARVRDSWQQTFGGSANSNKIAVLEEGMKYTPISISPEQAQFLETRKFQINEIARIFRVPPHMVGDLEKSSFSNIEQQSLEWFCCILDQLLSNAVKYTPEGTVTISVDNGLLTVSDTGVGIAPEDLPRIFEKGYTGLNGRLGQKSSGLGLYLAKKAADLLSIPLTVESAVGKGSAFTLDLRQRRS